MADKKEKKSVSIKKSSYYKITGDKVERLKKTCPKCGAEMYDEMDEHSDGSLTGSGYWICTHCDYRWENPEVSGAMPPSLPTPSPDPSRRSGDSP